MTGSHTPNHRPSHGQGSQRPVDASMTLLREVMDSPIDPGYQVAAGRKRRLATLGRSEKRSAVSRSLSLGLAVALGFMTITGVLSLRSRAELSSTTRQVLIGEIRERQQRFDTATTDHDAVTEKVAALHAEILESVDPELSEALARDELTNGGVAITGPGLRVTMADGPGADDDEERRVQDSDIRAVVNGLWASGAESIAINDKRLTVTTAIRSAGSAILVDLVGLSAPYTIEAIGDPDRLEINFSRSLASDQLTLLASAYGIDARIEQAKELELPAGSSRRLRLAQEIAEP
ncbi:DUF881 domain-containing protein [Jonesiaceae bacterium BS-20]|uniref:DUF881 domain-containing protein n=1 Tax=Jonesiaceae bacterium BS-20 TaxID=3120821 RepID=A0AAU7E004_9MICO